MRNTRYLSRDLKEEERKIRFENLSAKVDAQTARKENFRVSQNLALKVEREAVLRFEMMMLMI